MNLDVGTVQGERLNSFDGDGLRLKFLFDAVKDTHRNPVTKAAVDRIPVAEVFG